MLALAMALRARGHTAAFVAPANAVAGIRAHGFDAVSDGIDIEEMLRAPQTDVSGLRWQLRYFSDVLIPRLFESVARAGGGEDAIVASGVQVAASSVAEQRKIACVVAAFCPCAIPNDAAPPPTVKTQTLPHWLNRLLWRAGRPLVDLALRTAFNAGRARLGLPPVASPMASLGADAIILAADRDLAPLGAGAPRNAVTTDAWILQDADPIAPGVDAFLSAGDPPVYIGFGSMVAKNAADLAAHAIAAVRATGRRAIVAGGWAGLGDHLDRSGDVLVIRSTPHAALFPRVAAIIHHGGAGTTTAAARAGVPQVVVPHILDQYYWAHRVEALGLGPRAIPAERATASTLAGRVRSAVHEAGYRERASRLAPAIAARNGVGDAVDHLERLTGLR